MTRTDIRILLVEDNPGDARLVQEALSDAFSGQFAFSHVETLHEGIAMLDGEELPVDLILLDLSLPDTQGIDTFSRLYHATSQVPIVILSGMNDEDLALRAVRHGAQDYLLKSELGSNGFARVIRYSIERKIAENQLKASEARYRELFENANDCIFMLDFEGRFITLNHACERMTGYKAEELLNSPITSILTPSSAETINTVLGVGMTATEMIAYDLEFIARSGVRHILELNSRPVYSGEAFIGIENIGRDVTERKRADAEKQQLNLRLEEQHKELTSLYNATSILFEADTLNQLLQQIASMVYLEFGDEGCRIILLDEQDAVATDYVYYRGEEIRPVKAIGAPIVAQLVQTSQNSGPGYVRGAYIDRLFDALPAELDAKFLLPIRTHKTLVGFLVVARQNEHIFDPQDMRLMRTIVAFAERAAYAIENMRLNEALERHLERVESEVVKRTSEVNRIRGRIEAILNSSSDPIVLTDASGVIMQSNPAFERMFGYSIAEVFNQPLSMLVEPSHRAALDGAIRSLESSDQLTGVEVEYRRRDGGTRNGEIDFALLQTNEPGVDEVGIVAIIHDITQHKETQAGLHEALRHERELGELKSRFVSMVSHEFRTPLAVIQVAVDLLRKYGDRMNDERRVEHYENILSHVAKLRDLLDDVLTISKAESVGLEFNPTPVSLPQFCWMLVEEIKPISDGHQFELQAPDDFPSMPLDTKLMRQAVMNLLSNAVKYSPAGTTIHVSVAQRDNNAVLQIRDEGIGIPEEDQLRLFEVFHRARNAQDIQGSGLGLAIVKRAVEAHGGTIQASSAVNEGTTFTIVLPLAPPDEDDED